MKYVEGVVGAFNQVEEDALFLWDVPKVAVEDMPIVISEAQALRQITNDVLAEDWTTMDGHVLVDDSDRADSQYREDRLKILENQYLKLVSQ